MNKPEQSFHFKDGSSDKFWRIRLEGTSFTVHYGRVGTNGQSQTKSFASESIAEKECDKLVAEKLKKGYVCTSGESEPVSQTAAASKPPKEVVATPRAQAAPAAVQAAAEAGASDAPPPPPSLSTKAASVAVADKPGAGSAADKEKGRENLPPESPRKINLTESQWLQAFWRRTKALPRLQPQSFDFDRALEQAHALEDFPFWHGAMGYFQPAFNPQTWSKQEARFFIEASLLAHKNPVQCRYDSIKHEIKADSSARDSAYAQVLPALDLHAPLGLGDLLKKVPTDIGYSMYGMVLPFALASYYSASEFFDFWSSRLQDLSAAIWPICRQFIIPYLSDEELEAFRSHVRRALSDWSDAMDSNTSPVDYHMAGALGMHEDLLPLIESWPDDMFAAFEKNRGRLQRLGPQKVIFGLRDPKLVELHMRRLKLSVVESDDMISWIAHTEDTALDVVSASCILPDKDASIARVKLLSLVESPQAAKEIFKCFQHSSVAKVARKWLDQHPRFVLMGLAPLAHENSPLGAQAKGFLKDLVRKYSIDSLPGETKELLDSLEMSGSSPKATADQSPEWLEEALRTPPSKKRPPVPTFVDCVAFPPVVLDGWQLTDGQLHVILQAMRNSTPDEVDPLIKTIRSHQPGKAFDAFVWDVFDRWQHEAHPAKEKWAMHAVGMLGSEQMVVRLVPLMIQWREANLTNRAFWGLDCLRLCGTDLALMRVHEISQSPKLKSLRSKAQELMMKIAEEKGLTKAQLEDRIVPTCGLNEQGTRVFDFGSRQFTFAFTADLKPAVKDADGKLKTDLPAPNQKDDQEMAKEAVADWKDLKKNLKTVGKVQAARLEQAMVTGRTWTVQEFNTLLFNHPLMFNLIRLVIWAGVDESGKVVKTFRINEERKMSDEHDRDVTLESIAHVKIIHPLHMTDEQKSAWGEIFSDYEIVALFPQIGRVTYHLEPDEMEKSDLIRFAKIMLPAVSISGGLDRFGWSRGLAGDGGVYDSHSKQFYDADVTAFVRFEGIYMGLPLMSPPQAIDSCRFYSGIHGPAYPWTNKAGLPMKLQDVDPVVISEVLSELTNLTAKGQDDSED